MLHLIRVVLIATDDFISRFIKFAFVTNPIWCKNLCAQHTSNSGHMAMARIFIATAQRLADRNRYIYIRFRYALTSPSDCHQHKWLLHIYTYMNFWFRTISMRMRTKYEPFRDEMEKKKKISERTHTLIYSIASVMLINMELKQLSFVCCWRRELNCVRIAYHQWKRHSRDRIADIVV